MSTKIYNGIILENARTTQELWQFWDMVRKELIPIAEAEYKKVFFQSIVAMALYLNGYECTRVDLPFSEYTGKTRSDLMWFIRKSLYNTMKKNRIAESALDYNPSLDFEVEVGIYPTKSKVLAIPFINNDALFKKFYELPGIKDYGYWNNTDKPEDVTARQWTQRKKDWDSVLKGIGIPRENGPTMHIVSEEDIRTGFSTEGVDKEAVIHELCASAAKLKLLNKTLKERGIEKPSISEILDVEREVRDMTDEIETLVAEIKAKIQPFLEEEETA